MKKTVFVLILFMFSLIFDNNYAKAEVSYGIFMMVKGDVQVVSKKDGKSAAAKVGLKVFEGDSVASANESRAKIVMSDKNVLNILPDSKMTISVYKNDGKEQKSVELNVLYGKVRASVEQKYDGEKNTFNIKTPTAVAGVRGTDFITSFNRETKLSEVVTFTGTVAVGQAGPKGEILNPVYVKPGQSTSVKEGGTPDAPKALPKDRLNSLNSESSGEGSGQKNSNQEKSEKSTKDDKDKEKEKEKDDKGDKKDDKGDKKDDKGDKKDDKGDKKDDKGDKKDNKGDKGDKKDNKGDQKSDKNDPVDKKDNNSDKAEDKSKENKREDRKETSDKKDRQEGQDRKNARNSSERTDAPSQESGNAPHSGEAASGPSSTDNQNRGPASPMEPTSPTGPMMDNAGSMMDGPGQVPGPGSGSMMDSPGAAAGNMMPPSMIDTKDLGPDLGRDMNLIGGNNNLPNPPPVMFVPPPTNYIPPTPGNQFINDTIRRQNSKTIITIVPP